jgi:hypothetical protein
MTRADLIAAVRTASCKPYLPERECLAIVRGVLGVVREPGVEIECVGRQKAADYSDEVTTAGVGLAFTAMIDALLGEITDTPPR